MVELSWAYTSDRAMARATRVERVKRGIVLKGGVDGGSKKSRERRGKRVRWEARQEASPFYLQEKY